MSLDLEGTAPPHLLNPDQRISGGIQFTPDGKAVAYPITENGVDNIWIQPLNGSAGRQITNFKSEQIIQFHWFIGQQDSRYPTKPYRIRRRSDTRSGSFIAMM